MTPTDEYRPPGDPDWCQAFHEAADVGDDEHWTDLGGALGDHVVVNAGKDGAVVSLVDLRRPRADFRPYAAKLLALRIWLAADFALRDTGSAS